MVKNLNRRLRDVLFHIDFNYVLPKLDVFYKLAGEFLNECQDFDGKKFLRDLVKRLYVMVKSQSSIDDDTHSKDSDADSSEARMAIAGKVSIEDQLQEITTD